MDRKALLPFVAGALSMFLALSGTHTSIVSQSAFAASLIDLTGGYKPPEVAPLSSTNTKLHGFLVADNRGAVFQLDGINCDSCTFKNTDFVYSGGAVRCQGCEFPHDVIRHLTVSGAALNTILLLQYFQSLDQVPKTPPTTPRWLEKNPVIKIDMSASAPTTLDLIMP